MQIDQRALAAAMKKMGIRQQDIDASEVIIKCSDRTLIIKNPKVAKITGMGRDSFQIEGGTVVEAPLENDEDIKVVMEKAAVDRETAKAALKDTNGDIAEAILQLSEN